MVAPFPDPVTAFASGWMRVRARARQRGIDAAAGHFRSRRLGRPDRDHRGDRRSEVWVTHGQEDALVHWCDAQGLKARPLDIVGYGDEEESDAQTPARPRHEPLRRTARPPRLRAGRNAKLRLIADYLRGTPDPERGWALAALTGALSSSMPSPA